MASLNIDWLQTTKVGIIADPASSGSHAPARVSRAVAGRRQQRHDDIAERRRNAVLTPATLHHAVTNIPLQRSAIEAIDQNRGA